MFNSRKPSQVTPLPLKTGAKCNWENNKALQRMRGEEARTGRQDPAGAPGKGRLPLRKMSCLSLPQAGLPEGCGQQSGQLAASLWPLQQLAVVRQCGWALLAAKFSSWKESGEVTQLTDKEADLLALPWLLAGAPQDFPGPSEHHGEMKGQAWVCGKL